MTIQIKGQKIITFDGVALQPVEHMRSIGLCRRLVVGGRWYEDCKLLKQTIAERNNEKLNVQRNQI